MLLLTLSISRLIFFLRNSINCLHEMRISIIFSIQEQSFHMLYFKQSKSIHVFGLASVLPVPGCLCVIYPTTHTRIFIYLKEIIAKEGEKKTKKKNKTGLDAKFKI